MYGVCVCVFLLQGLSAWLKSPVFAGGAPSHLSQSLCPEASALNWPLVSSACRDASVRVDGVDAARIAASKLHDIESYHVKPLSSLDVSRLLEPDEDPLLHAVLHNAPYVPEHDTTANLGDVSLSEVDVDGECFTNAACNCVVACFMCLFV